MEFGGQAIWAILVTLGVVVLAGAMVYGLMRNRSRTLGEKVVSEASTKQIYEREDRDAS